MQAGRKTAVRKDGFVVTDITEFRLTVAVAGLGLIGGSLCKALKEYTRHRVLGLDLDSDTTQEAMDAGAVDGIIGAEELSQADLVFVCLHPTATIRFLLQNAGNFKSGGIVADVCGVKEEIVKAAEPVLLEHGVRLVGCHPMAGREFSGFSYSLPDLFVGASFIITPTSRTDPNAVAVLEQLARRLGFGQVVKATCRQHDRTIAFTSQLAHIVSSAYIKSSSALEENGFSAGSFQDLTRVAKLNENMWTDLFLRNKEPLTDEIDQMIRHLQEYRDAIKNGEEQALKELLKDGRERKEESIRRHQRP